MDCDEVNQSHKSAIEDWVRHLGEYNTPGIEKLASTYNSGLSCTCVERKNGSFNVCFKVVFTDDVAWAVRFPIPGKVMYPEEKVRREVAIMDYIAKNTRIPTPKIVAWGPAADNHNPRIGPFIITEWIEGVSLASILEEHPRPEWGPVLRRDIDNDTLREVYRQMASILLELSLPDFPKIGSLSHAEHNGRCTWVITSRPMTLKMNEIECGGYVTMSDHSLAPFDTVQSYLEYLVQQNIDHLYQQRNSIDDLDDARRKYLIRRQVKSLVEQFVSKDYNEGPFKLFCDDLRPGNILVDPNSLKIVGLIDLEWTYAAPYQFLFSPPPWLILEKPVTWTSNGIASYRSKFAVFIKCLEDEEARFQQEGRLNISTEQRMSTLMRRFMEDGTFWFGELVRESFNFDGDVLWPNIEKIVQAKGTGAMNMLDEAEQAELDHFLKRKLEDFSKYHSELRLLETVTEQELEDGSSETQV